MSYYKIIKGIKYDKQLLDVANEFVTGEEEAEISEREMQLLVKLAQDGRSITDIERGTLYYIRQHFNLSKQAALWFDKHFPPLSRVQAAIQKVVIETFDLPGLKLIVDENEVAAQEALSTNQVSFEQALYATLESFLHDGSANESPRSLTESVHEIFRDKFQTEEAWEAALADKICEYLNENSYLALHPLRALTADEELFSQPENGEAVEQNWIFQLSLRNLSDHLFWAVTSRSGEPPTYNYGFN
ncbi:MAG: hypothetical protein ACK4TA_25715 [Saprospiraceae bacterium]